MPWAVAPALRHPPLSRACVVSKLALTGTIKEAVGATGRRHVTCWPCMPAASVLCLHHLRPPMRFQELRAAGAMAYGTMLVSQRRGPVGPQQQASGLHVTVACLTGWLPLAQLDWRWRAGTRQRQHRARRALAVQCSKRLGLAGRAQGLPPVYHGDG